MHQHPAVLPDLTVVREPAGRAAAVGLRGRHVARGRPHRALLADVGLRVHLDDRVETLSRRAEAPARARQGARGEALAARPRRADRPARPGLGRPAVRLVRDAVAVGHRRSSTSPTGSPRSASSPTASRSCATAAFAATAVVDEISDDELLALIVGRQLDSTFPPKHDARRRTPLRTSSWSRASSGAGFSDVSLDGAPRRDHRHRRRRRQRAERPAPRPRRPRRPSTGSVTVNGSEMTRQVAPATSPPTCPPTGISEGLMMRLSVRENAAVSALKRFRTGLLMTASASSAWSATRSSSLVGEGRIARRERRRPCPAATSRRSWSPGRCSRSRRSCSPTSPRRASMSARAPRSTRSCAMCRRPASPSWSRPPTPRSSRASATRSS